MKPFSDEKILSDIKGHYHVTTLRTASANWDYTMMKGTIADIGKAKRSDKK